MVMFACARAVSKTHLDNINQNNQGDKNPQLTVSLGSSLSAIDMTLPPGFFTVKSSGVAGSKSANRRREGVGGGICQAATAWTGLHSFEPTVVIEMT